MDEWLKRHTYIVCSSVAIAKYRMQSDMDQLWKFTDAHDKWKVYISTLEITGRLEVYRYVSIRQVLHYFDGVDDVDLFEIDSSCSNFSEDELKNAIEILHRAHTLHDRNRMRVKWLEEHEWGLR